MTDKSKKDEKPEVTKPKKEASAKKASKVEAKGEETSEAKHEVKKAKAPKTNPNPKRPPLAAKTFFAKDGQIASQWRLVDATGQTLGRLGSQVAMILMGKDKPSFTRSSDTGDHVVVINAKDVVLTGKKWSDKVYQYHTGFPGGIKTITARELRENHPDRLIKWAVYGMLPKGHMGRRWYKKLRVFSGAEHPHSAQQPKPETGLAERS